MQSSARTFCWLVFAHVFLTIAARHAGATPAGVQGSSREVAKSIPPVTCPNRIETASWTLRTVYSAIYAFTEGPFVQAVHASQTDSLRSPGLNPQLPTGRLQRIDVKKKIRAWAILIDDEGTADQMAEQVRQILAQRPALVTQHWEIRRQIHQLEDEIDQARRGYAQRAAQAAQAQDALEAGHEAAGTIHAIVAAREQHRRNDAADREQVDTLVSALRETIHGLEAADDGILDQIKQLDAQVDALLGSPETCTVAEVGGVEYLAMEAPLDGHPGVGGGRRIFPDAPAAGAGPRRDVRVRATANPPIPGLMVHFKPFDRDDPLSDRDALDPNGAGADDNFSAEKATVDGSETGVDKATGGDGTVDVILKITLQPGDNFDVAAGCDREKIVALTAAQVSRNEASFRSTCGPLTVWRKLHVERDAMPVLVLPGPANYAPKGTIQSVVKIDKDQADVTVKPDAEHAEVLQDTPRRFEDGVLLDGSTAQTYEILASRRSDDGAAVLLTVAIGKAKKEKGEKPGKPDRKAGLPSVGATATLFDDDFDGTADRRLPSTPPPLETAQAVFREAFVDVVGQVPGSENPDAVLPARVSFDSVDARRAFAQAHFQGDAHRQDHFWVAYAGEGFQSLYARDFDPDLEPEGDPEAGATDRSAAGAPLFASLLWKETERDFAAFSAWTAQQTAFIRGKTVAHELAHQFGISPLHRSAGGLMTYDTENGGSNDKVNPSPLLMSQLRHVREWSESPGRRTRESE